MRLSFLHFIIGLAYLTLVVPAQALGSLGGDTLAINDSRSTVHTESSKSVGCSIDSIVCGHSGWGLPERDAAREAVRYLRSLPGEWSLDPGPGRCFRASCSYNTGVWICNDASDRNHGSWTDAGDIVQAIMDRCRAKFGDAILYPYDNGQAFTRDNYNVILRYADC